MISETLNASIPYPFKIDWKRCHTQRLARSGLSVLFEKLKVYKRDVAKQQALKIVRLHVGDGQ